LTDSLRWQALSEAQLEHSALLAHLRTLEGQTDTPLRLDIFTLWQRVVDGDRQADRLSPEDACDLHSVCLAKLTHVPAICDLS
jgi:hypothetical protein